MNTLRARRYVALLLGALTVTACKDLTVPDLNNPGLDDTITNPTRAGIAAQAVGLLIGHRATVSGRAGYISELGILGRESYNFDPADPRFVTELLIGPLMPGNVAFGGNHWVLQYVNMRNAEILLKALEAATDLTDSEKAATRGFARTIQALELLHVVNTRDENGAVIDVARDPRDDPAPIVDKATVFGQIVSWLDGADADLAAGGDSFPFSLSSGFTGFDTPATFRQFNRGLRARVAVYNGDFGTALTALSASFVDTTASFAIGVYNVFGRGSGDALNSLFDRSTTPIILAHPSIVADAQLQADGVTPDDRLSKVAQLATPRTTGGITTDYAFTIYNSDTAPMTIMRNEELVLLRAEANIGLGNLTDALDDINSIRVNSGGLAPLGAFANEFVALYELLYNKRYSLLFEGGHRWIDQRRYNRLCTLPLDLATHNIFRKFPIPQLECDARDPIPAVCQ